MVPVAVAILAVLLANLALVVLIAGRRMRARRYARRDGRLLAQLRRPALELVDGDGAADPPVLDGQEARVFVEILSHYGRQVRGEPHDRIVAYFETHGVVDEQLRRLGHQRAWVRATAAYTLGDTGAPRAAPALVACLDDRSPDVRAAACRSLGRLGAIEAIEPIVAAGVSRRVPGAVVRLALFDVGPPAVTPLVALCGHDEPRVRAAAVQLVGLLGDATSGTAIDGLLADPEASVRAAAAAALGRLGAGHARDDLVVALGDGVAEVRTEAARALGQIGGRTACGALVGVARDDAFEPAHAAAEALAVLDPALVSRLAGEPGAGPHLREAAGRVAL
ncbi:MAG TPA: HEAT repeat domain-containing protein [Acidimicrobiales bacterium]